MQAGLKEKSNLVFLFFFLLISSQDYPRFRSGPFFPCRFRCSLPITIAQTLTWELHCSQCCNVNSCSLGLCYWSHKQERHSLTVARQNEQSISSFILYKLLLFTFWGHLQTLEVTKRSNDQRGDTRLSTKWEEAWEAEDTATWGSSNSTATQNPPPWRRTCPRLTPKSLPSCQEGPRPGSPVRFKAF